MTDERLGNDADWNPSSFEEWLAHVAEAEGISEQEVLDQMMSSYWILDELAELMAGSAGEGLPDGRQREATPQSEERDGDDTSPDTEEFQQLFEIIGALAENSGRSSEPQSSANPARVDTELDRIRDDLDRLTTRIDNLVDQERLGGGSTQQNVSQPSDEARTSTEIPKLSRRVDELEAKFDDIASRQHTLQSNVDNNFSHVEDILQYVVDELDSIDARTEDVTEELSAMRGDTAGREQLRELKRQANVQDVETARCEHCDEAVTISLLARPVCPNCDRPLDGITAASGLASLFRKPVLTVASQRASRVSQSSRERDPRDGPNSQSGQKVEDAPDPRDGPNSQSGQKVEDAPDGDTGSMDLEIQDVLDVDEDEPSSR